MIPLRLQIKNFLSYGSTIQTIDFSIYKLICLSGKNGHGKSALLDAITWALWGQARKVGTTLKPDQGVLRLGEVEMMVCFDFKFNKSTYRVRRDYSQKYGKPHVHVEFGMLDSEDNHFISLTDKTTRKTQQKIETTLGLDYETFANSSFLRQGNANEFSKKSPKERKEILGAILGLNQYDKARTFILEKTRALSNEKTHLEKMKERLLEEYETVKNIPEEQKKVAKQLQEFTLQEANFHKQQTALEQEKKVLNNKQQEYKLLLLQKEQHEKTFQNNREELQTVTSQWKKTHKALLALPNKTELEKQKKELTEKITKQQETQQKSLTTKEAMLEKKEALSLVQSTIEKEHKELEQKEALALERLKITQEAQTKTEQEDTQKQTKLEQEKTTISKEIAQLRTTVAAHALVTDYAELQQQFEHRKELYQKWIEQGNWVNNELKSLGQKQLLSQDKQNPSCPLCEQNLSQARKRFLQKKFSEQDHFLTHRFARLKKNIALLKEALHKEHAQLQRVQKIETLLKQEQEYEKQIKEVTVQLQKLKQENKETITARETKEKILKELIVKGKALLEQNNDYCKLKQAIKADEKLLLSLTYNQKTHEALIKELQTVQELLHHCNQKDEYQRSQQERKEKVSHLVTTLKELKKTTLQEQEKLQSFANIPIEEKVLEKKSETLVGEYKTITQAKELLLQQKGNLEAQEKKRQTLEKEQKNYETLFKKLSTAIHEQQIISTALGKDGIQALLIEDALPEIEQEANDLLAKLTDNQAHISIESLRDLKKGGTRETLDINISDAQGIRPYELFSGGEAFRIDFALRIAISKLLARRAGTSLQTLIIDEGFGSQDQEGLNRMMDALYTIQEDFEKIIIVSHLASMKEQFPVHFYIEKGPQGSSVSIVEHG